MQIWLKNPLIPVNKNEFGVEHQNQDPAERRA